MSQRNGNYRREGDTYLIEIRLETLRQLFNSLDPAPFREQDLDPEADHYITGATEEFHLATPLKLVLHLPAAECGSVQGQDLSQAIHNYFRYRADVTRRKRLHIFRNGRVAMLIGLAFLFFCIFVQQSISAMGREGLLWTIVEEGVLISGWVAMWHPIDLFLYRWWPVRRRQRIYEKIAAMPVDLVAR